MRFPGTRNPKYYFPVTKRRSSNRHRPQGGGPRPFYLVGLDQLLVDIEVHVADGQVEALGLLPGESSLLSAEDYDRVLARLGEDGATLRVTPGGAVGNTLNNFTYLSGELAYLLGSVPRLIRPGDPVFHYVAKTPPGVDLSRLLPVEGNLATALTLIEPSGERSFAVSLGAANSYPAEAVPAELISQASAVLTTLYCLRDPSWPIAGAALRMMQLANEAGVPVALGMGTASLVRARRDETRELLRRHVDLAAMNWAEAYALTGEEDPFLACQIILDWVDAVVLTQGERGMVMGGWVDEAYARQTREGIRSKSIAEYNRYEYSRLMRRAECKRPLKIYSHTHPYRGGPEELRNTNGAGDAALAAVLHDLVANCYHRALLPDSRKHAAPVEFLSYSSLSRNAQYGNRVAYEVLTGWSPRLCAPVGSDSDEEG